MSASVAPPDAPRRGRPWQHCAVIAALGIAAGLLLPDQLGLLARIAITALFVLSLDLVVGVAGLATLGHAALFGAGAYAAGITALRWTADPLLGLAVGGAVGALVAALSALLLLRYQGFTFLMLTVAVASILQSLASKWRDWTGGDDGLTGFVMKPLLGVPFDFEGRVAYAYVLVVLLLAYYVARRVVDSPFGLSVLGIHQSRARMAALGTPLWRQLFIVYTLSGLLAGLAGALSAQTNAIVGLDSLGFALSAEAIVMLILGGAGRLYGALIGATVFMVLHHTASSINPYHWLFVVGGALMLVVLVPRERLARWLWPAALRRLVARRPRVEALQK
jgi:branched-chain amino acid transport system permease protein